MGLREPDWTPVPLRVTPDRGELILTVGDARPMRLNRRQSCALVYAVLEAAQRMGWCESGRLTSGDDG